MVDGARSDCQTDLAAQNQIYEFTMSCVDSNLERIPMVTENFTYRINKDYSGMSNFNLFLS